MQITHESGLVPRTLQSIDLDCKVTSRTTVSFVRKSNIRATPHLHAMKACQSYIHTSGRVRCPPNCGRLHRDSCDVPPEGSTSYPRPGANGVVKVSGAPACRLSTLTPAAANRGGQ